MELPTSLKRARTDEATQKSSVQDFSQALVAVPQRRTKSTLPANASSAIKMSLVPRSMEMLSLTINPEYTQRLVASGELGFERLATHRIPTARYYEISLTHLKAAMKKILDYYLPLKLIEQDKLTTAQIVAEVTAMTPIIVDACIIALYARMRIIHRQYGQYTQRFPTPPSYARDIELPLPFADAIQSIGVFEPQGVLTNYVYIPVYPEGIQNEGRSAQEWQAYKYEAYVPILKSLGIPVKSVDTRIKIGTPWWTYKSTLYRNHFDLVCIFPPSNYTDHSALVASMFILMNDAQTDLLPLIKHQNDDSSYPTRFREITEGFQLRAFSALCHAPKTEWSQALLEI